MNKKLSLYKFSMYVVIVILSFSFFLFHFIKKNELMLLKSFQKNKINILENTMSTYINSFKDKYEKDFNNLYLDIDLDNIKGHEDEYLLKWNSNQKLNTDITRIYLTYEKNNLIITNKWTKPEEYKIHSDNWNKIKLLDSNKIIWLKPYIETITNTLTSSIVKVINSKSGNIGIFTIDVNLNNFTKYLNSSKLSQESTIILLSKKNEVLAHSGSCEIIKKYKKNGWFNLIKNKDNGNLLTEDKDQINFYIDNESGWKLISITNKDIIQKYIQNFRNSIIILIVVFFIVLLLLYEILVLTIMQKNKKLISLIRVIKEDNIDSFEEYRKKLNLKDYLYSELYDEIYILSLKWFKIGKKLYKDLETGLYKKNYFDDNIVKWPKLKYEILLITYLNLDSIKDKFGENIAKIVLKRGALIYKKYEKTGELGFRYDTNMLGLIIERTNSKKRIEMIMKEIKDYKWKLNELKVEVEWLIMEIDG